MSSAGARLLEPKQRFHTTQQQQSTLRKLSGYLPTASGIRTPATLPMADDDDNNDNRRNHRGQTLIIGGAGFVVLTVNTGLAMYRARGDAASAVFVAASYLLLLLLFACLRFYERAAPGSPARARARRAVWPVTALLTLGFAWKVAAVMPSPVVAAGVWGLAVATTAGGFFALLFLQA